MAQNDTERLERQIHRTLRSLPDRRAPRTLEARVLAAIAARQALPWWRQSFVHWPVAARAGFVASSLLLLALVTVTTMGGMPALPSLSREWMAPIDNFHAALSAIADAAVIIWQRIPMIWLHGALICIGALYAALFGLGATVYRTLVINR